MPVTGYPGKIRTRTTNRREYKQEKYEYIFMDLHSLPVLADSILSETPGKAIFWHKLFDS